MLGQEDKVLLIRLDEKLRALTEKLDEIVEKIDEAHDELREDYVTKKEFEPIKRSFYTVVGVAITGIIGTIFSLFLGYKRPW